MRFIRNYSERRQIEHNFENKFGSIDRLINLNLRYADKFERTKVFMTEDGNMWEE